MFGVSERTLQNLRKQYPEGTRVKLIYMEDPYRDMPEGLLGTVTGVDDIGTIHVNWDNGSCLGIAYGEDRCCKI